MDWCVDLRVQGAVDAAAADITAHLRRHAELPEVVDLAEPLVREALEDDGTPMRWLSVEWDDLTARLAVSQLAADGPWPQPGPSGPPLRPLAPGVVLGDRAVVELRAATVRGPVTVELPVVRQAEADIDPHPVDDTPPPSDPHAFALAALALFAGDDPNLATAEEVSARFGASVSRHVRPDLGAAPASLRSVAEALVSFEREMGGDFFLVEADDTTAVLGNHRCPFGDAVRDAPSLCRVTSALAGRLAADATADGVHVLLPERLAVGDHQCRVVLGRGDGDGNAVAHRYGATPVGLAPRERPRDPGFSRGLQVSLSMRLPRDELSVPLVRRLTRHALDEVGVVVDDRGDVELAVTEAAGNVMDHAGPGDAYDVTIEINPMACEIRVVDIGRGFDHEQLDAAMADTSAEEGRGVALMHALMDQVRFSSHPERGTIVHLVKSLRFDDDAPARSLMLAELRRRDEGGDSSAGPS